jgi:hypothetical protein
MDSPRTAETGSDGPCAGEPLPAYNYITSRHSKRDGLKISLHANRPIADRREQENLMSYKASLYIIRRKATAIYF